MAPVENGKSPAVENIVWYDLLINIEDVGEVKYTFTAKNADSLLDAWMQVEALNDYLLSNYPGAVKPGTAIKAPGGTKAGKSSGTASYQPDGSVRLEGVFDIAKVTVEMRQDGRPQVNFFGAGDQWPRTKAVMKAEQLMKMFEPLGSWTIEDFQAPGTYEGLNIKLHWKESEAVNSKGNRYKNVMFLENGE